MEQNVAVLPKPKKIKSTRKADWFFLTMSVAALAIVLAGFVPTYLVPRINGTFVAKPGVHLHGLLFMCWILAGILQPLLVRTGNTRIHRRVGVFLGGLAAIVWISGIAMAIISARIDVANGEGARPVAFLLIPLSDMVLFATFVGAALFCYKRPEYHKRLMLLATVAILPAPFARLFGTLGLHNTVGAILIINSFIFAGIAWDLYRKKPPHRVYLLGGALILAVHFYRTFFFGSEWWMTVGTWITE